MLNMNAVKREFAALGVSYIYSENRGTATREGRSSHDPSSRCRCSPRCYPRHPCFYLSCMVEDLRASLSRGSDCEVHVVIRSGDERMMNVDTLLTTAEMFCTLRLRSVLTISFCDLWVAGSSAVSHIRGNRSPERNAALFYCPLPNS